MASLKSFLSTVEKKPSTAPDRKTDDEASGGANGVQTSLFHDLTHLNFRQTETVAQAITTIASGEPLDDKELLLEHGVNMLQTLPPNSTLGDRVGKDFIKALWNDLPHPAATVAGNTARYRSHDGSGNNPWKPDLGKAGNPYARNVPPAKPKGPNLPDYELVFEQLLKRKEGTYRKHPSGLNRLFFSFATIVIHECFQTRVRDQMINETSSYVDLSTLYGNTIVEQKRVRTYEDGRIYPDSIASERIMMMPPGVVAVLLMFSRNHNTIAEKLLSVNEDGWYKDWRSMSDSEARTYQLPEFPPDPIKDPLADPKTDPKDWTIDPERQPKRYQKILQDEDIFQLARNINVGFFATVVLKDYVAAILNTPRANSTWYLDLGCEIKDHLGNRVERGTGNVVSVEFAVLYHWHAALSQSDDEWMQKIIRDRSSLQSMDDLDEKVWWDVIFKQRAQFPTKDPGAAKGWEFDYLKRGPDGRFKDAEIADLIKKCIEEPAHEFGAHGTPASLKYVDILGMRQAREKFNVCTMNEFRKYLNLMPYKNFGDWCEDKETARAAELLYGHIDNLELYPGLMAECTKPAIPGSGVCPGQTTGRGILDDAVSLVRGDRFLSYDLNSNTLTNFGVGKLGQTSGGSYGGVFNRLLFNGLPYSFTGYSPYVLLPFYTPEAAREILKGNNSIKNYDLERPSNENTIATIVTYSGCKKILEDRENFPVMYRDPIREVTGGNNALITLDEKKQHDGHRAGLERAFFEDGFEEHVSKFYRDTIAKLIKESSLKYPKNRRSIDIVRDVTNVAPVLWLAQKFAIPIKTEEHPDGLLSIPETFEILQVILGYTSFNPLPAWQWDIRAGARKGGEILREVFVAHLKTQKGHGIQEGIADWLAKGSAFEVGPEADRWYHALNDSGRPIEDLVADCIGLAAPAVGIIASQAALVVDLFLTNGYEEDYRRIVELARKDDADSKKELEGYVLEGMRCAPVSPGPLRVSAGDITITDGEQGPIHVKAKQTVLAAIVKANMDPAAFPNPKKLDPHRPRDSYLVFGYDMHKSFGQRLGLTAITAMIKEIFKLNGLKRASGRLGQFSTVKQDIGGIKKTLWLDANSRECGVPTTLTLEYLEGIGGQNGNSTKW